ncbi:MAG: hypothetical protein HEQ23_15215 [Tepidisphaera sp.]
MAHKAMYGVLVAFMALVLCLAGCGATDHGKIYRIPPLVCHDKDLDDIDSSGRINPYKYRFPDQSIVKPTGTAAKGKPETKPATTPGTTGTPGTTIPASSRDIDPFGDPPKGYTPLEELSGKLKRIKQDRDGGAILESQAQGLTTLAVLQSTESAYTAAQLDTASRNRLQTIMIGQSNVIAAAHLSSIMGLENEINVLFGVSATSTAAVAGIVSPVGTKNILTALSAIFSASRDQIREHVYQNAFGSAIVDRIVTRRQTFLDEVINPRRMLPLAEYPVDAAISDVLEYHNMGSFYEGVVQIGREVAQGNMSSQRPSAAPKEVTVQPAATVVTVKEDGKGSIDVQITRTTTDAFTVTIQGVTVTSLVPADTVLRPASSDDKLKVVKYDLRGTGKVTINFTAAKETSSFDLIVGDATHQVAHKVIQIEHDGK